jgi:hypothetical protein
MSVPGALTAIVIILGVMALLVVGVCVLAAILLLRVLRLERELVAEAGRIRKRLQTTMADVGETTRNVTSSVGTWGTRARYAGLAAEAATALLAWRRRAAAKPPARPRAGKSRIFAWAVPTGIIVLQVWRRTRRPRGSAHKTES